MKKAGFIFAAIFSLMMMSAIASAQVTVAGSTGANGSFTTLKGAFDAINANAVQTGNNITISISANTTETATAQLNTGDWASVVITPTASVTVSGSIAGAIIRLNGADTVTIDGRIAGAGRNLSVINNSTATATAAIWLSSVVAGNGAMNNIIRNLELACGADQRSSTNSTFGIIQSGTTISVTSADGNDNDNNQFIFNRIIRVRYGIVSRGVTTNNNLNAVITDNIIGPAAFGIDQVGKVGIYMQADTGALVSRNIIQTVGVLTANTAGGSDRFGIAIGSETWDVQNSTTITSGDYTVTRNIIHDIIEEKTFSSVGIRLGTTRSGVATNNLVANNFIYNVRANGTPGDQVCGIGYAAGHTDRIIFNSIALTGDQDPGAATLSTTFGNALRVSTVNGTNNINLTMMNNSIYLDASSGTAANRYYAITLPTAAYVFGTGGLNYNNYYIVPTNTQLQTGGLHNVAGASAATTQFATLANWQAALTVPQDANSIQADPQYISPTADLHLLPSSPNINTGLTLAGIIDDVDGQVRPNGANSDIGADEFYPSPGALQFSAATYNVTETAGTVIITVTRSGGINGIVTADYATVAGGSATGGAACTAGVDYINTSGTVTFPDLSATPQTFAITVCADGVFEPSETVNLALTNPTGGATLGTPNTAVLNILDAGSTFTGPVNVGTGQTATSLTNPGGIFDAINNGIVTGNVTINITSDLTGETGAVALNEIPGGFTVLIRPSGGPRNVSGSSAAYMIPFNGTDNVTFDGSLSGGTDRSLTVTNTGSGGGIAFTSGIAGAQGNTLKNVNVVGGGPTVTLIGIAFGGNAFGSAGTDNDNNRIENNSVRRTIIGIYSAGASVANQNTGTVVTRNDLTGTGADRVGRTGMVFFNDNGIQVTENRVGGISTAESIDAVGIGVGVGVADAQFSNTAATSGGITNALVSRNQVNGVAHTNTWGAVGIAIAGDVAGANIISNNMVTGVIANTTSPDIVAGIFVAGVTGSTTRLYHNSVANTGDRGATASQQASFAVAISGTNPIVELKNNIFYNTQVATGGGTAAESYSIGMTTATFTNLDSNYNDFYVAGANASFFRSGSLAGAAGTDYATLALWQAAVSDDANSQEVDPLFVNPTNDLHLQGTSPVLGDGLLIAGVDIDFDNDLRDDAPDIGADEIVSGRTGTIPAGTYRDANLGAGSTLGGNVTIQGTLTLSGVVTTGASTLTVDCAGTVSGASNTNYVDGNVQKNFCAPGTFTYPVGDPATGSLVPPLNGYMPVDVTVTALGVNPSNLAVSANNGLAPSTPPLDPTRTLSAFWTLTETGDLTANLSFNYQQGDVNGNEAVYRVISIEGGTPYNFPTTVLDTTNNIATVPGITNFSDWTVGEAFAPTSSPANVSGRVMSVTGFPIPGVTMTLLDTILVENRTTVTDANGEYSFSAILTGRDIVVTPSRLGYNFSPQTRAFPHTGNVSNIDFTASSDSTVPRATSNDFDGDGKADVSVFRPADATWYIYQSLTNSVRSEQWGLLGDTIVPADYDGDRKTDVAVFRPSNATWYILESTTGNMRATQWGLADDVMTPADFDGDGKVDVAVWRPSSGTWYIRESLTGNIRTVNWGMAGDRPVAADYDADGKADLAVFRPSTGTWYVVKSSDGSNLSENWGLATDRPVVGDYDGDTKSDLAVFRPDNNTWYVKLSSNGTVNAKVHGTSSDFLTPGDFDGDGKTDHAVWQNVNGNWNILRSTTGAASGQQWGINGDIPAPSAYIP